MNPIAQLQLRDCLVEILHVDANPDFHPRASGEYESQLAVDFSFHRAEGKPAFRVDLDVQVNSNDGDFQKAPYRIWIKTRTFLEFDRDFPEKKMPQLLGPNGLAMAYGIARGVVAQATGTAMHGKCIIPSVNFVDLLKLKAQSTSPKVRATKGTKRRTQ